MTKEIKVGDTVIYNGYEAFNGYDGVINIGQIGVVKYVEAFCEPWTHLVDFGVGGVPKGTTIPVDDAVLATLDISGLEPMEPEAEINLYEGEAQ